MENTNISPDENQQQTNENNMNLNPVALASTIDATTDKPAQKKTSYLKMILKEYLIIYVLTTMLLWGLFRDIAVLADSLSVALYLFTFPFTTAPRIYLKAIQENGKIPKKILIATSTISIISIVIFLKSMLSNNDDNGSPYYATYFIFRNIMFPPIMIINGLIVYFAFKSSNNPDDNLVLKLKKLSLAAKIYIVISIILTIIGVYFFPNLVY